MGKYIVTMKNKFEFDVASENEAIMMAKFMTRYDAMKTAIRTQEFDGLRNAEYEIIVEKEEEQDG